jgi:CubicO group peptidase (beta-lactamase class C family)
MLMGGGALALPMPLKAPVGRDRALERSIDQIVRRHRIPGLSIGVTRRGRPVLLRGFGFRDRSHQLPVTPETVFGIASMTKSFTALAILRLQEDRALRVSDPVVRHLPEFRTPDPRWTRRITLGHFLSHSSGLPPLPSIYYSSGRSLARDPPYDPRDARRVGIDPDHPPIDTYEGMLEYLATERYRLLGPPGAQFSYSNEAFGLLGAVIERASGRTYEGFVEEAILRPAGMHRSTFDTGVMFRFPEVTRLYSPDWIHPHRPLRESEEWWEDTCLRAAGALRTNVTDLLRYIELYLREGRVDRERVVAPSSLKEMLRPRVVIQSGLYYGYGIAIRPDYAGRLLAFHDGGLKGVASGFAVLPRDGIGGTALANADTAPAPLALRVAINRVLGLPTNLPFMPTPPRAPATHPLTEYDGWYCSGEGIWCRISARRTHLRADFRGIEVTSRGLKLVAAGPDAFVVRQHGQTDLIRFERDERGRISSVFGGWRLVRRRRPEELPRARKGRMVW